VLLTDQVRQTCQAIAESARFVSIDPDAVASLDPGEPPALDPQRHYLEGSADEVAHYLLVLDSINFGSGWFPTLRKRPGHSGYFTVAASLTDHWRGGGAWSAAQLRALTSADVAAVLGQEPDHELMGLYAEALHDLGRFLGDRRALDLVAEAGGSAERFASMLAAGMPFFDDRGFWKRAQIAANDLALAGVAEFADLDRLTIFADNLVPHVLRVDGVLRYDPSLAARIDAGELLPPGEEEHEIRACAVHACELIAARTAMPARLLDTALWTKGQAPRYKSVPRHRTRTVFY
jgi:Potential Queuosine, Q, salvage protein family